MPLFESFCPLCGTVRERYEPRYIDTDPPCLKCGGPTEREITGVVFHDFHQSMGSTIHRPFVTSNIRADGKPMEITSHAQLNKACKENGVVHVPDRHSRIG